ncbi:pro-neuropeptide Y-like isoform X1 [Mizuhopecten yessoensis]|uniref:Neuropeptide F n=1 Tax=Mizuhopecten yessoensis TaxID=6573 RepID=A0A210PXD3_MIZYE|nr:pro-neuropeptide Y-like isoform X1 [Mizuhopecten yessoensis]AXN93508.1 neuropeptide F [Mizuhopecten yessoensis]OWF41126.1 Pro-neuropeptide Y [Mizuhopecten yessoensis]
MQKFVLTTVLIVCALLVSQVTCQEAMLEPPDRPHSFRTPDQLRSYLRALNEYYSIVGRPRFGRSVNKRSLESSLFNTEDLNTGDYPAFEDERDLYI